MIWNRSRAHLRALIGEASPRLGGVYRAALRGLSTAPQPGEELARIAAVANGMRELMSKLEQVVPDLPARLKGPHTSSKDLLEQLPAFLEETAELLQPGDADLVSVPREAVERLLALGEAVRLEYAISEERASVMLTYSPNPTLAVKHWKKASAYFTRWAHLGGRVATGEKKPLPTDAELLEQIEVVEAILRARLAPFFDLKRELAGVLRDANDREKVPDVARAIPRIGALPQRQIFYRGLDNPAWVSALAKAQAFAAPPRPRVDDGGRVREEVWPEIDYLIRMAPEAPAEVVAAIEPLLQSENSWVRRGVVQIAAAVPGAIGARLAPGVIAWVQEGPGFRTDPRHLAMFAERLLTDGGLRQGRRLADALYRPQSSDRPEGGRSAVVTGLEAYWYEETLPRIAAALGPRRLSVLLGWLEAYERAIEPDAVTFDRSIVHRRTIRSRIAGTADIQDSLVDAIRDAAIEDLQADAPGVVALFQHVPVLLAHKVLLFSATEVLRNRSTEGRAVDDVSAALTPLVGRSDLAGAHFRPEYPEFLAALASAAGPAVLAPLDQVLEAGPLGSREALADRVSQYAEPHSLAQEVDVYLRRWQHELLASVGATHLPEALRHRLHQMDESDGPIDHPNRVDGELTSWFGPTSPLSRDEMATMSPAALAQHLRFWHADPESWAAPSHEGQARELRSLTEVQPSLVPLIGDGHWGELRPTYLRALLEGLAQAVEADREVPWSAALSLSDFVLAHDDAAEVPPEGRAFDDDVDYRAAKDAVVRLVQAAGVANATGAADPDRARFVGAAARFVIGVAQDESTRSEYWGEQPDSYDPLTLSLNTRLTSAAHALVTLTASGKLGQEGSPVLAALDELLELDDPHLAIAAVLGESLSRFYNYAELWLRRRTPRIFGGAGDLTPWQEVALSTALATQRQHSLLLTLLQGPISAALDRGGDIRAGWGSARSPDLLIGDWLLGRLVVGVISADDPLVAKFFTSASVTARADVLGHLAWGFMRADALEPDVIQCAQLLWESRLAHVREHPEDNAELAEFFWYARSEKFPASWWLPQLRETLDLLPTLSTQGMIGAHLAAAAREFPALTFEVVEQLTRQSVSDDGMVGYDLMEHAVPQTIASALDAGDDELAKRATDLMNELGRKNDIDLDERVRKLRRK